MYFARIVEGTVKKGTKIRMMATGAVEEVVEVGYFGAGQFIPCDELICWYGWIYYSKY